MMHNLQKLRLAICFLIASSTATLTAFAQEIHIDTSAPEFKVIDGDSIDYGFLRFRLCGIQAPERERYYYEKAKAMLHDFVDKKLIVARIVDTDKYDRQVVVMWELGKSKTLNEKMVAMGSAKHYKRFSQDCEPYVKRRALIRAENAARRKYKGIWGRD